MARQMSRACGALDPNDATTDLGMFSCVTLTVAALALTEVQIVLTVCSLIVVLPTTSFFFLNRIASVIEDRHDGSTLNSILYRSTSQQYGRGAGTVGAQSVVLAMTIEKQARVAAGVGTGSRYRRRYGLVESARSQRQKGKRGSVCSSDLPITPPPPLSSALAVPISTTSTAAKAVHAAIAARAPRSPLAAVE